MGHDHNHSHNNNDKDGETSNIKVAFFLNLGFTIIEFIGGILTNSVAIIADALHDLGDSISLGFSWFLSKYSKKGRTEKFSYGYRRFSLLGAFLNSIILIIGSIVVIYTVIPRLLNPEPSNYNGMIILAILGIIINSIAVLRLKKGSSLNEKVISWHLFEDVLGWIAILIISVVNLFVNAPILDPILALVFTVIILVNVIKNLKPIVSIFLQSVPSNVNTHEIEKKILNLTHVKSVHDIHLWTMDDENNILSLHVVVKDNLPYSKIKELKSEIKQIAEDMNIEHITIEIEQADEICDYEKC